MNSLHSNPLNRPAASHYGTLFSLESISIDYGIMERSQNVLMVPATFRWSDLGSWTALDEVLEKDHAGNILKGNTIDIGSQNSICLPEIGLLPPLVSKTWWLWILRMQPW